MSKTNDLTNSIISILLLNGHYAWRQNNGGVYDPVKRTFRRNSSHKGVADIIGVTKSGKPLFIEIKTGRDIQSIHQKEFQAQVTKRNAIYLIASCCDDVLKAVIE